MTTYYIDPVNGADGNDGLGWWRLAYTAGHTAAPAPGVTVTGTGGATGIILSTTLSSGTWAGNNAAGYFYMYGRNGTAFANGENITWTGGSCTNNQGTPYNAIYSSFKTDKKTFAAGDTIKGAMSPETAAAGTVTATTGSVSVATTNDLTGVIAQYTVIRIGGDNTLYMVKARTSSVITLYRPYRGTTGAGKGITYYTGLPTSTSNDWNPTSMPGTSANHITIQGGINPATNTQDGFTVLYGNNATYCFNGTYVFADISNIATLYFGNSWSANLTDCSLTNCFNFRSTNTAAGSPSWLRPTINGFVSELGSFFVGLATIYGGTINNIETADDARTGLYINASLTIINTIFTGWRNAGYSGQYALQIAGIIINSRFVDPIFDELASGCTNLRTGTGVLGADFTIQNPTLGAGTFLSVSGILNGKIGLINVNGSLTDHRQIIGSPESGNYSVLTYDASVFNNAAPSAKVTFTGPPTYPVTIRHYIPCDAGVLKTISVYLRKSSSPAYGSSNLPFMRLRWLTGTAGALVSNVYDSAMSDTNDSFVQVSHAVTPSVQGVIIMELIFLPGANGAIGWYDDIGVV